MNGPDDRSDAPAEGTPSELGAAYARASHADGSRPSLSARASILANAQREAAARAAQIADAANDAGPAAGQRGLRIEPTAAANESLWNWRAAAGFAGVAFAGVLALWLYRGNPEPVPQPQPRLVADMPPPAAPVAPDATAMTANSVPMATAARESASAAAPQAAEKSVPSAPRAPVPTLGPAPAPAPTPTPRAELRLEQAADTRARTMAAPSPLAGEVNAAATVPAPAPSAAVLLQRWFPQALDSDADGQQYWFVLDRDGVVLRSGQRAWTDLPALQGWLEGNSAVPRIARMEATHLVNRRGHDVELAYAWAAPD